MEPQDTITVAPNVLLTIVRHATLSVDGVAGMGTIPAQVSHLLRGHPMGMGVVLEIDQDAVRADLYIVVRPGVNMREVSISVQHAVKRSIEDLIGIDVETVNVHIEDVDTSSATPTPGP